MITNMYTLQLFVQVLKTGIQDHIRHRTKVAYRLEEKHQVAQVEMENTVLRHLARLKRIEDSVSAKSGK